ncbi:hypothetical protein CB1_001792016 [Camelus ferus]|nr:hypothetical protein CB1_001792016 [Camelus ferus]
MKCYPSPLSVSSKLQPWLIQALFTTGLASKGWRIQSVTLIAIREQLQWVMFDGTVTPTPVLVTLLSVPNYHTGSCEMLREYVFVNWVYYSLRKCFLTVLAQNQSHRFCSHSTSRRVSADPRRSEGAETRSCGSVWAAPSPPPLSYGNDSDLAEDGHIGQQFTSDQD